MDLLIVPSEITFYDTLPQSIWFGKKNPDRDQDKERIDYQNLSS